MNTATAPNLQYVPNHIALPTYFSLFTGSVSPYRTCTTFRLLH